MRLGIATVGELDTASIATACRIWPLSLHLSLLSKTWNQGATDDAEIVCKKTGESWITEESVINQEW